MSASNAAHKPEVELCQYRYTTIFHGLGLLQEEKLFGDGVVFEPVLGCDWKRGYLCSGLCNALSNPAATDGWKA